MSCKILTVIAGPWLCCLLSCSQKSDVEFNPTFGLMNGSFELDQAASGSWTNIQGWESGDGGVSNNGYYAPLDGNFYAVQSGGDNWAQQPVNTVIEAGKTYTLTAWVRSFNGRGMKPKQLPISAF